MKNYFFKLFIITAVATSFFIWGGLVLAAEAPTVYFFFGEGCPHCADEEVFLEKLKTDYSELDVQSYEVWFHPQNAEILRKVAGGLNIKSSGVPITVIGEKVVIGFSSESTTGKKIRNNLEYYSVNEYVDAVSLILAGNYQGWGEVEDGESTCDDQSACSFNQDSSALVTLPFFGEVDARFFSLPLLTVVIAALDGFNPCAMWVLIFLISLLIGMEDKSKMWVLGSSFIITSGLVYFLFLTAWLNLFLFIGFISWVRLAIGAVAIASGVYHLRDWYVNKSGLCKVTGQEKKRKIMDRLKQVSEQKKFWLALVGIISVAVAVNLVELVCSAGLPAIYTNVLSLSHLPVWQYYAYLLVYIVIFMLDDVLVFVVAMATLKVAGLTGKYSRWSSLIGGVIILILGILLIFKPGWIMFG